MIKRDIIIYLIVTSILLFIATVLSYLLDLYFKIIHSLFFLSLAILFVFKFAKIFKDKVKKQRKSFIYILKVLIIYSIPIFIVGYVLYFNWVPFGYEKTYFLDIGKNKEFNQFNSLYIKESERGLSEIRKEDKIDYRSINNKLNYVFLRYPKIGIEKEDLLNITTKFRVNNKAERTILRIGLKQTDGRYLYRDIFDTVEYSKKANNLNNKVLILDENRTILKVEDWFIFNTFYNLSDTDISLNRLQFVF